MALIQWRAAIDPFRELRGLDERLNRIFSEREASHGVERGTSTFPPLDIRTDAENVYVTAELPGVPLEALELSISGDTLSLKGERKAPAAADEKFHRRERAFGHFSRLVGLPEPVDADRIQAALKDGILRVTLPKAESAKPRQIKVARQ